MRNVSNSQLGKQIPATVPTSDLARWIRPVTAINIFIVTCTSYKSSVIQMGSLVPWPGNFNQWIWAGIRPTQPHPTPTPASRTPQIMTKPVILVSDVHSSQWLLLCIIRSNTRYFGIMKSQRQIKWANGVLLTELQPRIKLATSQSLVRWPDHYTIKPHNFKPKLLLVAQYLLSCQICSRYLKPWPKYNDLKIFNTMFLISQKLTVNIEREHLWQISRKSDIYYLRNHN